MRVRIRRFNVDEQVLPNDVLRLKTTDLDSQAFVILTRLALVLVMCQGLLRHSGDTYLFRKYVHNDEYNLG